MDLVQRIPLSLEYLQYKRQSMAALKCSVDHLALCEPSWEQMHWHSSFTHVVSQQRQPTMAWDGSFLAMVNSSSVAGES